MKYVYVLTSSKEDFYYEQFLISLTSLRLHNPNAYTILLLDSNTKQNLAGKRTAYKNYVSEEKIIEIPVNFTQKEKSRWLKTSMRDYIPDDFLYIDCDTVITDKLNLDCNSAINIAAVLDTHVTLKNHHLAKHFETQDKNAGFSSYNTGIRYNGGVIYSKDDKISKDFFSLWHSLWLSSTKNGSHHDMPPLNQANMEAGNIIHELDGTWNCQISHNGLPFLTGAKIIHYYATAIDFINSPFIPASVRTFSSIKETGEINPELLRLLENPKVAFEKQVRIVSGNVETDVLNSKFYSILLRFRKKSPVLFKKLNILLQKTANVFKRSKRV
ncbi:MAG: hypothetical protein FWG77_10090 [Treponema sp.]|nr:hypothetical protein [Treponema sp.]